VIIGHEIRELRSEFVGHADGHALHRTASRSPKTDAYDVFVDLAYVGLKPRVKPFDGRRNGFNRAA
jgi:hypothetical protein